MPEGRGHHPADPRGGNLTGRYTPDDVGAAAPRSVITFGPCAVLVGFLVGVIVLALAFAFSAGLTLDALAWDDVPAVIGAFFLILWWGMIVGIFTGLPLGIVLGLLLLRVRHQWIHVAVFFTGFAGAALGVLPAVMVSSVVSSVPAALVVGGAGALARASVWRLVRVRGA
ncbi:hypothetical protein AC792_07190 [Arthrobacter sp. RIT-PI-e]|uniref:hypothetical protein n=1 Tax=Arthrobacter sp. RIT-PI-e TaxID=1681197 RepID=UPI0006769E83|nr:hypothetical protein [Arthrobacter sp. RIT-PI-e]KNC19352.1 hypothetical protein AC792_07190 [Arthrobacter sp. RIT-PI-e]